MNINQCLDLNSIVLNVQTANFEVMIPLFKIERKLPTNIKMYVHNIIFNINVRISFTLPQSLMLHGKMIIVNVNIIYIIGAINMKNFL